MEKEAKKKITKDMVPEGFTLGLAVVDALPVLFFGAAVILLGTILKSPLFIIGAALCFFGGAVKVLWKIIVVLKKKNIWWMFIQMRYLMPLGFVLMIVAFILHIRDSVLGNLVCAALQMPVLPFVIVGVLGFVLMGVFAAKLDSSKARSNWIEQITNGIGQLAILIAMILLISRV